MSEELATNPEMEVDAPAEEVVTDQPEVDVEETTSEQSPVEDDFDEVEYEGNRYAVPKELKDAILRHSDYTQKTQEVASQRKALEEEKAQIQKITQVQREDFQKYAQLSALDEQLKGYENVDWQAYEQQDPQAATALFREYVLLKDKRGGIAGEISQREQQRNFESTQKMAKLKEETASTLQREIKNWSPDYKNNLAKYGKDSGFTEQELMSMDYDARQAKILNKAYLYDQMLKKAEQKPVIPTKPTKVIGKKSPATTGLSDSISAEEWVKRREAQLRKA